jgi:protein-L-isoaspartate(D-aspartate) O-methyltransferase
MNSLRGIIFNRREMHAMVQKMFVCFCFIILGCAVIAGADDFSGKQREELLREINSDARHARDALGRDHIDERVMQAMRIVPRHEFVPSLLKSSAYLNIPLPIGHGQTISQPFIVALMTDLLNVGRNDVVLEIGTGSGYQAAVLAELAKKVYSIEIIKELGDEARDRLQRLGYKNVDVRIGDGYYGWEEHAPFDSIIVTAAAGHVPAPLVRQLKQGGTIVIPIGSPYQVQTLMIITKDSSGAMKSRQVIPVSFVPMTGKVKE